MKKISSNLAAAITVIFFSSQASASGYLEKTEPGGSSFMAEAIEQAEMAKTNNAHAKHIRKYAKMSLKYVKKAEIEAIEHKNTNGRVYITGSIRHLVEAIGHAKTGETDIASEHIASALEEMNQFITK